MLILAALVVVPTASLSVTSPVAFAQGEQDQGSDVGTDAAATATPAPEGQESVTPSPSASPTMASPSGSPSAPAATSPDGDGSQTPRGDEPSTPADGHSGSAPTIASDLADYPPGGTVTLTGAGWKGAEVVTIVVNDTGGLSWKLTKEVVADAEGRLTLTFNLPNYYVPDYDVTATGALSGVATTTFTDGATGGWRYWMTASSPATWASVAPGATVVYNLLADTTGGVVDGAVATLTLSDNVDGALVSKVTLSGTSLFGKVGAAGGTATWTLSAGLNSTDRSAAISALVAADAPAGLLTATISGVDRGTGRTGTGMSLSVSHTVFNECSFATAGTGAFARTICWFDLSGYNAAAAASANGQIMQQPLRNGYVLSYTIKASIDTNVIAHALPTYGAAFLGNKGFYAGIKGMPALYQQTNGGETTLALTDILLKDSNGNRVTGFALVGADAESTHDREWITWSSDQPITSAVAIADRGNECGGGFTGIGSRSVTCTGDGSGDKTGAAILYSRDPVQFTQRMKGAGLQAVAFGVMVSGIQLNKQIVNKIPGDQFSISVARDKTVVATAITDPITGGAAAPQVYTISAGSERNYILSEAPVGLANPANYATTWACTKNNTAFTPTGTSTTVVVSLNDFVECTITNTGPALTLRKSVDNTAGGTLAPADWTLTATKSGSASAVAQAPSLSSTTTGNVTTASTAKVPVPASEYTLGESSAAASAGRYAANLWSCTNAGTGSFSLVGNKVTIAPGNDLTCTITNTYVPNVTLRSTWVDGVNGDKADLVINSATTSPGKATSTSNGEVGSWTDTTNLATATPAVGSTVSIAEALQATNNKGTYYTSPVVCVNGNNTVVPVAGGVFKMPNSNVTCDYSKRPVVNTVTWSKVDAGATTTLLAGSEWVVTGPSYPSAGIAVADCSSSPCAGPDTDPAVGRFKVTLRCGNCTLIETRSPAGFQLGSPYAFSILADGTTVALGPRTNKRVPVPAIPLTGGLGTDSYLISGMALLLLAGLAAWHQRRRRIPHPRA